MKKKKLIYLVLSLIIAVLFGYGRLEQSRPDEFMHYEKLTGKLTVSYLDVGQGDSSFITFPSGRCLLIDAGEREAGQKVVDHIRDRGYDRIDYVVCTHPHADHIGGMAHVIGSFDVGAVYMPAVSHNSKSFEDVLLAVQKQGVPIEKAQVGVTFEPEPGITLTILAPREKSYEEMNDYSAVVRLGYGETAFLFTGDAEAVSEQEMLASGSELSADVLKVAHHGSSSSSSKKFLQAVQPRWAVISVGENNDYGHPHREISQRLADQNITVLRTDQNGTVVAISDGVSVTVRGER